MEKDVYSLSSFWDRAHISSEMRDAVDVLQAVYKRQNRVFSDGPSDPSGGSRHTDERDLRRQKSAGYEAPSCRAREDTLASEQDNSFAAPSHHGDSRSVPRGNVGRRGNPAKVVEEEGRSVPTYVSKLKSKVEKMNHLLEDVSQGLTYERERRRSLDQTVQEHLIYDWMVVRRTRTPFWNMNERFILFVTNYLRFVAGSRSYGPGKRISRFNMRIWFVTTRIS